MNDQICTGPRPNLRIAANLQHQQPAIRLFRPSRAGQRDHQRREDEQVRTWILDARGTPGPVCGPCRPIRRARRRGARGVIVYPQDHVPLGQQVHHVMLAGRRGSVTARKTQNGPAFDHASLGGLSGSPSNAANGCNWCSQRWCASTYARPAGPRTLGHRVVQQCDGSLDPLGRRSPGEHRACFHRGPSGPGAWRSPPSPSPTPRALCSEIPARSATARQPRRPPTYGRARRHVGRQPDTGPLGKPPHRADGLLPTTVNVASGRRRRTSGQTSSQNQPIPSIFAR